MKGFNLKYLALIIIILLLVLIIFLVTATKNSSPSTEGQNNSIATNNNSLPVPAENLSAKNQKTIAEPISNALARVTKKPFGIYVSPTDSPVSPEKFTGYHAGVDFETFSDEQNSEVAIYVICSGPLVLKKSATGYGGVAVQQCQINGKDVTVIYGHLRLNSITAIQDQLLNVGEQLGILGKGYSPETSDERKHLHLGIHQGKNINLLGYVQNQEELSQWLDVTNLLK
ncbi:MAG: hypothetical protein WC675_03685 [Patescibacteria group bacterium]|jgi:hypothetical protein